MSDCDVTQMGELMAREETNRQPTMNDKDKALFEKNSFTGWYHGNHCLMDAVQFEQAIKERDEQRTCKNCKYYFEKDCNYVFDNNNSPASISIFNDGLNPEAYGCNSFLPKEGI